MRVRACTRVCAYFQGAAPGAGNVNDMRAALEADKDEVRLAELTPAELAAELANRGKYSDLVKLTGKMGDIMMSHSSWFTCGVDSKLIQQPTPGCSLS